MNIILLSGGSGTRLWPLSNDIRSKQFIKIFKNKDKEYESMVQRVYIPLYYDAAYGLLFICAGLGIGYFDAYRT